MKKVIFMMGAAALALASCSSEEQMEVNTGRAISFRQGIASRATETTVANLTQFSVSAYKGTDAYFADTFTGAKNTSYTSAKEYYWPGDNSTLTFYAYAPTGLAGVTMAATGMTVTDFSPAATIGQQIDFVSAINTGTKKANEGTGVDLTFGHNLAQIEIRAFADNDVYDFEISGIKIARAKSVGTFTTANGWAIADNAAKADYESECAAITLAPLPTDGIAPSLMGTEGNAMLLPQELVAWVPDTENFGNEAEGAYLAVKLKVTAKSTGTVIFPFTGEVDGETKTSVWAAVPVNTKWEAGNKYVYTLDFSKGAGYVDPEEPVYPDEPILGDPITFTVDVTPWTDSPVAVDMDTNKKSTTED